MHTFGGQLVARVQRAEVISIQKYIFFGNTQVAPSSRCGKSACSFQNAPINVEIGFFIHKFTYMLAEGRRLYVVLFERRFVLVISGLE